MRKYRINMTAFGISRWAYEELKAYCRQYPEKKALANAMLGIGGGDGVVEYTKTETRTNAKGEKEKVTVKYGAILPRGNKTSDPTARAAERREKYLADCDMIDKVARKAGGGKWERALILNACYGMGYNQLDPSVLPSSNRSAFFQARREFFWLLHEIKFEKE